MGTLYILHYKEAAGEREVWVCLLRLLPPMTWLQISGRKWMDRWMISLKISRNHTDSNSPTTLLDDANYELQELINSDLLSHTLVKPSSESVQKICYWFAEVCVILLALKLKEESFIMKTIFSLIWPKTKALSTPLSSYHSVKAECTSRVLSGSSLKFKFMELSLININGTTQSALTIFPHWVRSNLNSPVAVAICCYINISHTLHISTWPAPPDGRRQRLIGSYYVEGGCDSASE